MVTKVVVFGEKQSGKTALIRYLKVPGKEFEETSCCFETRITNMALHDGTSVHLWNDGEEFQRADTFQNASLGVYCINLSHEFNVDTVNNDINHFKRLNPDAPIFIVGTCHDIVNDNARNAFNHLFLTNYPGIHAANVFSLSVKDGTGAREFFQKFQEIVLEQTRQAAPKAVDQIDQMQNAINKLPESSPLVAPLRALAKELEKSPKKGMIGYLANQLVDNLLEDEHREFLQTKVGAINHFEERCKMYLHGDFHGLKVIGKLIAAIVVTATVLALAAAAFMACVAFGVCTAGVGPILVAAAIAAPVAVATGGLSLYGMFKPTPELQALNEVTACARKGI